MQYRRFGRTDLRVSVVGLGSGGPSQLGQKSGVPAAAAIRVVRRALDLGINLLDTSAAYGESEAILGRALQDVPRDRYVLATKFPPSGREAGKAKLRPAGALTQSLERSLQRLGVDYVDVFQLHGVAPQAYRPVVERFLPEARRAQEQGKFRFLGISEVYVNDGPHAMLRTALAGNHFDTIMVGYNLLAPGAERVVLPAAQRHDVGVMIMFAVRRALSQPDYLVEIIAKLKDRGLLTPDAVPRDDPLGWLVHDGVESVTSAAYKFAAAHPAVSSVLSGTANIGHLEDNVCSVLGSPLPAADRARVLDLFGHIEECVVE